MTNLKENIDYYMNLKGIKMYSHLLVDIAHELGMLVTSCDGLTH